MMNDEKQGSHGHIPVMRERMVELISHGVRAADRKNKSIAPASSTPVIVDATLGAGGHSEAFLEAFPHAIVVGIDRDPYALEQAQQRLASFGERFIPYVARFDHIDRALGELYSQGYIPCDPHEEGIAGAFFDLGVSSMQLDQTERGFAYKVDAPLDMRMDPQLPMTAADILNTYSHGDLARILKTYGDERFAGKIASAVLKERDKEPFQNSGRLVELLYSTIPAATRRTGGHPAKRTFQALRVEVNAELEALEKAIPATMNSLSWGGVMVFMSYQSLEDRIVKQALVAASSSKSPPGLPMDLPGMEAEFSLLTRGAERASDEEIAYNSRSAPVRVRAAQRVLPRTQEDP